MSLGATLGGSLGPVLKQTVWPMGRPGGAHLGSVLAAAQGWPAPPFDVRLVGLRRRVQTALGLQVPVQPAGEPLGQYERLAAIRPATE